MKLYIYAVRNSEVGTFAVPINSEIPVSTYSFSGFIFFRSSTPYMCVCMYVYMIHL